MEPRAAAPMSEDRGRLVRATLVKTLGTAAEAGRAVLPMALIALFSSGDYGVLVAALGFVDLLGRFVITGFSDSVQFVAAREEGLHRARVGGESGDGSEDPLPGVVGAALIWSVGAAAAAALLLQIAAGPLHRAFYEGTQPESLAAALRLLAWSLPLQALAAVPLAALRSRLLMGPDVAVNNLLQPLVTVAAAVAVRGHAEAPLAMAVAHLCGAAAAAALSWAAYARRFPPGAALAAALRFAAGSVRGKADPVGRDLAGFAAPQGTSALAALAIERGDSLVLAAFVPPPVLALYAVASDLARLLRTVKANFSTVLSPLVARQAAERGPAATQAAVDLVAGWIVTAALPALFVLLAFRHELFALYGQPAAAPFFPLLLVAPLASCAFGLAGNVLLMTGHARLNLSCTVAAMAADLALALALVPRLGPAGAALAGALSQSALMLLLRRESRRRLGVEVGPARFAASLTPGIVLALAAVVLEFLLPAAEMRAAPAILLPRVFAGLAALGLYLALVRRRRGAL